MLFIQLYYFRLLTGALICVSFVLAFGLLSTHLVFSNRSNANIEHPPLNGTNVHRARPVLPDDLASDIQMFVQTEFARQYFTTHRSGFIFRRKIPVEVLMIWQKVRLDPQR